jgi:hypothetical protein
MSETLTLMVATKACQASDLALSRRRAVCVLTLFVIQVVIRAQSNSHECLLGTIRPKVVSNAPTVRKKAEASWY